jgi:hypothetical protein
LGFEPLEDRRMLSGYFDNIRDLVAAPGTGSAIGAITQGLTTINSLTKLPLINKPVQQISQLTGALASFRGNLYSALNSLGPASTVGNIQTAVFNALGPSGANVLANKVAPGTLGLEDVVVVTGGGGVDISIDIGFSTDPFTSAIGLGIDAVPFKPQSNTNGGFAVGLTYSNFNFGYNTTEGAYFRTSALDELKFTLNGDLPTSFTAGLGFLNFIVTDATPGIHDLTLSFTADVTPSFGLANPKIGGSVNLLMNLEVQVSGAGMPKLRTDLRLNWAFPNVLVSAPQGAAWGTPLLRFENVQLNLGSLMGSIAQPIAQKVKVVFAPLAPVFDILQTRIPALSDISEVVGGPTINLLSLSTALSALPNPPTQLIDMIQSVERLRIYSETVNALAGNSGNGWILLGSFDISAPGGGSLLNPSLASLVNTAGTLQQLLGNNALSSLVTAGSSITFDNFKQQIRQLLGNDLGDAVNSLWDNLGGEWNSGGDSSGLTFEFPIVENPSGIALAMLLGQDADLVKVAGQLDLNLDKSFDIDIVPGFFIHVTAEGFFFAYAAIGYDTRGMREAIAPLYLGQSFDSAAFLHGFWIDPLTRVDVEGTVGLAPGVGFPDIATFTIGGELTGHLDVDISNPGGVAKIRPLKSPSDLGDRLFNVAGHLDANANATLKVGVDLPLVGFVGIDKTWTFASVRVFEFDSDHIDIPEDLLPPIMPPPVNLASYDLASHTLTLNAGARANLRGIAPGEHNENFTIRHLYRDLLSIDGGAGSFAFDFYLRPLDEFEVSAFGVTQRFSGQVDTVYALMGDGNDTLKVEDVSSSTFYVIFAGEGDDVINVDGQVDVTIYGEEGSDRIDGGSGRSSVTPATVYGGPGTDYITFGDGRLANVNPNASFIVDKSPFDVDDFSTDYLTIDNSRSTVGTNYYFLSDTGAYDVEMTVVSDEGSGTVSRSFYLTGVRLDLFSGSGNDQFLGVAPPFSRLYGGDGDDLLDLNYYSPGQLPVTTFLFGLIGYTTFFGGEGNDTVLADDSATVPTRTYLLDVLQTSGVSSAMIWKQSTDVLYALLVGGIEDTQLKVRSTRSVQVKAWADGAVQIEAGEVQINADSYMLWDSTVKVRNTPRVKLYDANPESSFSSAGLDANGPYVSLPLGFRVNLNLDAVATIFSFQVDLTTVDLSPELLARPWNIAFDGPRVHTVVVAPFGYSDPNGSSPAYVYRLDGNTIQIGSKTWQIPGVSQLNIFGGQGSDIFEVDGVPTGLSIQLDGGFGDDQLKVGDDDTPFSETVYGGIVWNGGEDTDSLQINDRGASGPIHYTIGSSVVNQLFGYVDASSKLTESFTVIGSFYYDNVFNVAASPFAPFEAHWNLIGGQANDSFVFSRTPGESITVDGGDGYDSIYVYEDSFEVLIDRVELYSDRLVRIEHPITPDPPRTFTLNYDNFEAFRYDLPEHALELHVYGTSPDIAVGNQSVLIGSSEGDAFYLHPRDENGNLTIPTNLAIGGGDGTDSIVIEDSNSALPIDYVFYNQFGPSTANIGGLGSGLLGVGNDVESIQVNAGSGDDTFRIDSFQSGSALSIFAGGGSDSLEITPTSKNVSANITSISSFNYDAGPGIDYFYFYNDNSPNAWTYTRTATLLRADRLGGSTYFLLLNQSGVENLYASGGTQADGFLIQTTPSGTIDQYDGKLGDDTYTLGNAQRTSGILGAIQVYGDSGGTDSVNIENLADTIGRTVHVNESFVGATPGDNLFGPGGYLQHIGVTGNLVVQNGTGNDSVYVVPSPITRFVLHGNDPTPFPGDFLGLAFADALNPVQSTQLGFIRYDFSNRRQVAFRQFEDVEIDSVRPQIVESYYTELPPSAIIVKFNQDVSDSLLPSHLTLFNLTAGLPVPASYIALSYNVGISQATFTFPGFPNGRLPGGEYMLSISASIADLFGNTLAAGVSSTFEVEYQPPALFGDYDFDGVVGQADYGVWKANFGHNVFPGIMGDGNGDGIVNAADYTVWRNNLGAISPVSGGGSSLAGDAPSSDSLNRNEVNLEVVEVAAVSSIVRPAALNVAGFQAADSHAGRQHSLNSSMIAVRQDGGLLAWLASQSQRQREQHDRLATIEVVRDRADAVFGARCDVADSAFETLPVGVEL